MNIVVLQDYLRSGGTERQSVLLAAAFAAKGHKCTLLSFRPGGPLAPTLAYAEHQWLQAFDTKLDWFAPGLVRRLRKLKPQVILCMGRMANCHAGYLKRKFPGCVVVATMRTGKALPLPFRLALKSVDQVVANSQEARKTLLQRYAVPNEKISVINNSLVFKATPKPGETKDWRTEFGASKGCTILLCVAMFRPEKNQRGLIDIVAGLPADFEYQLWLAGDGPCLGECERMVEDLGLQKRVRFLGWLPDPSFAYAAADIAVHASWSEALSNFIIEAQAHGVPAVVYDAQGNSECMRQGITGFIIPQNDRFAFRSTIIHLATEDAETKARRSQEARNFARSSFDHNRQVTAYLNLFRDLGAH